MRPPHHISAQASVLPPLLPGPLLHLSPHHLSDLGGSGPLAWPQSPVPLKQGG